MNGLPDPTAPPAPAMPAVPAVTTPGTPAPAPALAPSARQAVPRLALFRLGGRLCGITAAFCKQFIQLDAVTPVPLAPAHLLGVTQLRGRILPVLDVTLMPGLPGLPELPEPPALPELSTLPEIISPDAPDPLRPPGEGAPPPAASGMPALVVTATGLDSALAALKVTEIVGFERPATAASAAARPLWRGEEVAVLDVAALLATLRPGLPGAGSGPPEPAASGGEERAAIPSMNPEPWA